MSITVLSACYGGYDTIHTPISQDRACDWVLVTDTPVDCAPWRNIVRPSSEPARLAAKHPKARPDLYTDSETVIWVDASIQITSPSFVSWCVSHPGPIAQIPHPQRSRISDEAEVLAGISEYESLPVREQAAHYIADGFEDGWGLWATGLIVYRQGFPVSEFGEAWLNEMRWWTIRDQLSQAPLLYRFGIRPTDMPGRLWGNPHFGIRGHRR